MPHWSIVIGCLICKDGLAERGCEDNVLFCACGTRGDSYLQRQTENINIEYPCPLAVTFQDANKR